MKASDAANLLLRSPDSDVRLDLQDGNEPVLLSIADVSLNSEANAWIVVVPKPVPRFAMGEAVAFGLVSGMLLTWMILIGVKWVLR